MKSRKLNRITALAVIVFLWITFLMACPVWAADHYVSTTGSASWAASTNQSTPCSWATACTNAAAGDTVYFLDGTYNAPDATNDIVVRNLSHSGTSGNPITLKALNRGQAILDNYDVSCPSMGLYDVDYIVIDGFTVVGGILLTACHYCIVQNCEVTVGFEHYGDHSLRWGIAYYESDNGTIQNNYVHSMESNFDSPGAVGNHNSACIMLQVGCDYNTVQYNSVNGQVGASKSNDDIGCLYGTKGGNQDYNTWQYNFGNNGYSCGFMSMGATNNTNPNTYNIVRYNIIINTTNFFECYRVGQYWDIYNNTGYNCSNFCNLQWETGSALPTGMDLWNNISHTGTNMYYRDASSPNWPGGMLGYVDYNLAYNETRWGAGGGGTFSFSAWKTQISSLVSGEENGDYNSANGTNPNFANAGGTSPEDYKRSSYPTDGRGGSYASVKGAYITGTETIGYSESGEPAPSTPSITGVSLHGVDMR